MSRGRLEAPVRFTSNQHVSWTNADGQPTEFSIAVGTYTFDELARALQAAVLRLGVAMDNAGHDPGDEHR